MSELTTEDVRQVYEDRYYPSRTADFDAWHRKELAKAWEEGADYGYDACANGEEEKHNPYKEA